jgi:nitric oxide reductase activation protein
LLDMSASTDFAIPDPDAPPPPPAPEPTAPSWDTTFDYAFHNDREPGPVLPKRRVIDVGRESLALMAQALETLGDAYALYGFSGYGRDNVEFHVAKEFGERLAPRVWSAMAAMQPRSSTRMGTAIRHALTRLVAQQARLKVLIVISDGYPQDRDYGPDARDDEYGIQDTARALMEAHHAGVQTFCVTIDPAGHDYLRRMCPDAHYLIIDEVNELPHELTKVYRALTA